MRINSTPRSLLPQGIASDIHTVLGHSGIPGNDEADSQLNMAQDARRSTRIQRPDITTLNRATRISEGRSAAKAEWEADMRSKHFSYRLKGNAGKKRPILIIRIKLVAAGFYQLTSGHATTGVYLKQFGHRDHDQCLWCAERLSQTPEHLFRHCSQCSDHQRELW